jgi:hypothetical protein
MKSIRKVVFFYYVLCLVGFTHARLVSVSTTAAFKTAVATNLAAGDTVELADGTYDFNTYLNVTVSGTPAQPILIKAKNTGKAILINKSYFDLKGVSYVTIQGFDFKCADGTVLKIESCKYVRVTRNIFHLVESTGTAWVIIQDLYNATAPVSEHNRIDHNLFENKTMVGNMVRLDGFEGTPTRSSQYDLIDHNYFRNTGPRIDNGMETIRMGVSSLSSTSGFGTVEYNLFEDCNGDPEFVSVKTDDNVVRYNTFRRCMGTCCLRQTSRSSVYGNFFLGEGRDSTGGVRVYRSDNTIYNNYFANLRGFTWDAALTVTDGDADSNTTNQSSHFRAVRTSFVNNTLVSNYSNFEIGYTNNGSYSKPPKDLLIANNIVVGTENPFFKYYATPVSQTIFGNIMYPTGTATLGITATESQIRVVDPQLQYADSIWRLSAASPAIDAAVNAYSCVVKDIDGQNRIGLTDIGADEYSTAQIVNRPLMPSDVGPYSEEQVISSIKTASKSTPSFILRQNYPNPFNPSTSIGFSLPSKEFVSITVYSITGKEIMAPVNSTLSAGDYKITFNGGNLPSGIYLYTMRAGGHIESKKMILLK